MAGQDLFDQRRARAWKTDDEDRKFAIQSQSAKAVEEGGGTRRYHVVDKSAVFNGIVAFAAFTPVFQSQSIGVQQMLGGLRILLACVEDLRQTEVQPGTAKLGQSRLSD